MTQVDKLLVEDILKSVGLESLRPKLNRNATSHGFRRKTGHFSIKLNGHK